MAKKHAPDRKPYSPVDAALMRSLPTIFGSTGAAEPNPEEAVTVHEEAMVSAPPLSGQQEPPPAPGVPLSATGPAPSLASDAQARPKASSPERLTKYLKFQVSHTEQMDIVRIVHHFAGELGTSLDWSHVARALMLLFRHAEPEILKYARRHGPLTRPPNYNAVALAEFEHAIAQILIRALQDAEPLH
jgi:hypothetical protein